MLSARNIIHEPFCVVNADDYYGKKAFVRIHNFLIQHPNIEYQYCVAGFILKNTLSKNGPVSRGICLLDNKNQLISVKETHKIIITETGVIMESGEKLNENSYVI